MNLRITTLPTLLSLALLVLSFAVFARQCSAETSLTRLRSEVREALIRQAAAETEHDENICVNGLCDLYVVLRSDPRYETSEMLRGDAAKVRRRLLHVARTTESKLKRADVVRPSNLSSEVDRMVSQVLAESDSDSRSVEAFAAAGFADQGWQLVELIGRILDPDFWEPRGGSGSIHYFALRRVLVVRATSDVHERIRDLLTALR